MSALELGRRPCPMFVFIVRKNWLWMGRFPGRTSAPIVEVISIPVEIANSTMNTPTTGAGNPRPNMFRIVKEAISASTFDSAHLKRPVLKLIRRRR